MTGDITFSAIGDTGKSKGLCWTGSTDGASIYYQTSAADQGNLVLNLTDDDNCYLRIAKMVHLQVIFHQMELFMVNAMVLFIMTMQNSFLVVRKQNLEILLH